MKYLNLKNKKNLIGFVILLALIIAGVTFVVVRQNNSESVDKVTMTTDHKEYGSVAELRNDSSTVIVGQVLNNGSTYQEKSPGISGDGAKLPGLVETAFSVKVVKVLRGSVLQNSTIDVILSGGDMDGVEYVEESMPWLEKGQRAILYLNEYKDKYYPMAGGAAIATETSKDASDFTLSSEVTGGKQMKVSESKF